MKIAIIGSHSWPIPLMSIGQRTGDYFYALHAKTLDDFGHEVYFCAPDGSYTPPHGMQISMTASLGNYPPSSEQCEEEVYWRNEDLLKSVDIVHDYSTTKWIAEKLYSEGLRNIISSPLGGVVNHPNPSHNIVFQSEAHRLRAMRGATDYEHTDTPDLAGPPGRCVLSSKVVHNGIDTDFYCPTDYKKEDYLLWMGRWHPARGYKLAIDIAKRTGKKLILAGEHPDREIFDAQRQCAYNAIELAGDASNISFRYLPPGIDHHKEKRKLMREAAAYLYTVQFNEPFGLSQVEALACGTPVIATNYGSMPEIIGDGAKGYNLNNNIDEFCYMIENHMDFNYEYCRTEAVRRFDRKVCTMNYIKLYQDVMSGRYW